MTLSENNADNCRVCEFEQNVGLLRQTRLLAGVPVEALKVFAYLSHRQTFAADTYLFRQGADDGQAFYIIAGRALLVHAHEGREAAVREYGPDEFLGGLALMGRMRRLFSLKALTSEVVCLILSREKFQKAWRQFPDLTPRLLQALLDGIEAWEKTFLALQDENRLGCISRAGISVL